MSLLVAFYCIVPPNTDCTSETRTPRAPRSEDSLRAGTATEGSS